MVEPGKTFKEESTTHEKWIKGQGIPIFREFSIPSLKELEVGPWERLGAYGAYVVLEGAEDSNDAYVLEISPKGTVVPERHTYEEVFYVLSGRGATTVWQSGGPKRTFEWHEGSFFAIPLNVWHQFFNGHGNQPARFYVVTSAPLVMNLFHNLSFVFNNDFVFDDRFDGQEDFFSGKGEALPGRVWETNFIEDIRTFPLIEWKERGAGGVQRRFQLSEGTMVAHVSQFPVGTYKKCHRHGAGAHVIIIQGKGYSLLWKEGQEDKQVRVDWKEGSVLVPPDMWWHQHFNTWSEPAKYLAIRWGSIKYPLFKSWIISGKTDTNVKEGGNQIEYEDEDPYIRQLFEEELRKNGIESRMPPIKYNK